MSSPVSSSAAELLRKADAHMARNQLREAEKCYRAALKGDGKSVPALVGLARIGAATGHAAPARELLHKALTLRPNDASALVTLGQVELALRNLPAAEAALTAAVESARRNAVAWNLLGLVRQHQGKVEEAETAFRTAVRLEPKFADALNNLATNLMLRGGHDDEALKIYRKSASLNPRLYTPHMNIGILLGRRGRRRRKKQWSTRERR